MQRHFHATPTSRHASNSIGFSFRKKCIYSVGSTRGHQGAVPPPHIIHVPPHLTYLKQIVIYKQNYNMDSHRRAKRHQIKHVISYSILYMLFLTISLYFPHTDRDFCMVGSGGIRTPDPGTSIPCCNLPTELTIQINQYN